MDATTIHRLTMRAKALGAGAEAGRLLQRFTSISGPDDPKLVEKLNTIPAGVGEHITRRLCEIVEAAPGA